MKILLIGNLGYLGPVVSAHLKKQNPNYYLVGLDTGFFTIKTNLVTHCYRLISKSMEI